jgi:ABC-type transport system involved in multi-copper enzyme maturation permease subunit
VRELGERIQRATLDNPILVKEFRTRMRGARAYWILLGYTLMIATILGFTYYTQQLHATENGQNMLTAAQAARDLGKTMYFIVFISQAIMVALITPAITSGAITIEREQRSYELLVTTPLRPIDLIRGKLTAAVAFVVLLLTASLPLVSLTFLVGGVSPGEIFFSYLIIALASFVAGTLGIFWSAALKSTAVATVATYVTVMVLFLVSMLPGFMSMDAARAGTGANPAFPLQSLNPVTATFRAVQPEYLFGWELPSWVSAAVLLLLFGVLIMTQALGRLESFEPPSPAWPRICATLFWVAFGAFTLGPPLGEMMRNPGRGLSSGEFTGIALLFSMITCCFVVPIWNTGDLVVRKGENALGRYLGGFSPHRLLGNDLPNGLPLTLAWVALMVGMIPFGALTAGKLHVVPWMKLFVPGVVLIAAVVYGFAGLGNLLSVHLPSRWAACILGYAAMVALGLLPYFVLSPWAREARISPSPIWNLLYLVPMEGIGRLVTDKSFWGADIPLPVNPVWLVTASIYTVLGTICFLAASAQVRSVGAKLQARTAAAEAA